MFDSHSLLRYLGCITGSARSRFRELERDVDLDLKLYQVVECASEVVGVGWGRKQSRGNVKVLGGIAIGE